MAIVNNDSVQHAPALNLNGRQISGEISGEARQLGTAVLLDGKPDWSRSELRQLIEVDRLIRHPDNPRTFTPLGGMQELVDTIREEGVLKAVKIIRGPAEGEAYILSGHRRHFAARAAGLKYVPCDLDPRILTRDEARALLIVMNEHDLKPGPVDSARSYYKYMQSAGLTPQQLAKQLSVPYSGIRDQIKLLELPEELQKLVNKGELAEKSALYILRLPGDDRQRIEFGQKIVREKLTRQAVRDMVKRSLAQLESFQTRVQPNSPGKSAAPRIADQSYVLTVAGPGDVNVKVSVFAEKGLNRPALSDFLIAARGKLNFVMPGNAEVKPEESRPEPQPASDRQPESAVTGDAVLPEIPAGTEKRGSAKPDLIGCSAQLIDGIPHFDKAGLRQLVKAELLLANLYRQRFFTSLEDTELLKQSIEKFGMLEPLKITWGPEEGTAYIISGHRRWYVGARLLGMQYLPCDIEPARLTEQEMRKQVIMHNLKQIPPAPLDRARSYSDYMKSARIPPDKLAAELSISHHMLYRYLKLLQLPPEVQGYINSGKMTIDAGVQLLQLTGGDKERIYVAKRILAEDLGRKEIQKLIEQSKRSVLLTLGGNLNGVSLDSTSLGIAIGGGSKARVRVECTGVSLTDVQIAEVLEKAAKTDLPAEHEKDTGGKKGAARIAQPVTGQGADEAGYLPVPASFRAASPRFARHLLKYLGEHAIQSGEQVMVLKDSLELLTRAFGEKDLLKAGIILSRSTWRNYENWKYGESVRRGSATITGMDLIDYWSFCIASLEDLSREKKFTLLDLSRKGIDIGLKGEPLKDYYSVRRVVEDIEAALGRLNGILKGSMLSAHRLEKSIQSASAHDVAARLAGVVKRGDELLAAGFKCEGRFNANFFKWLGAQKGAHRSTNYIDEGPRYDLSELYQFSQRSLAETMRAMEGKTEGQVSKTLLERRNVYYSEMTLFPRKVVYSKSYVLSELQNNIMILAEHAK